MKQLMNRRYILRDREILTPDAVSAILAKASLLKGANQQCRAAGSPIGQGRLYYAAVATYASLYKASDSANQRPNDDDSALLTMLASEAVLGREWNTPQEDEAWADL
jgi:hypothetical protein